MSRSSKSFVTKSQRHKRYGSAVAETLEGRQLLSATAVGLQNDNRVIRFEADNPGIILSDNAISGLRAGEQVVGIDHRPTDINPDGVNKVGVIYGVTSHSRLITLNPNTGQATIGESLFVDRNGNGMRDAGENLNILFSESGVDFNPTVDRLRLVNGRDENFRVNVDTGLTIIDGTLAYAATENRTLRDVAIPLAPASLMASLASVFCSVPIV